MDRFRSIDWIPPLTDIIDDVFINEERLIKEGAMYQILRGHFTDPFKNMETDYQEAKLELLEDKTVTDNFNQEEQKVECQSKDTDSTKDNQKRSYVPGIVKIPFKFPRPSSLNKEQQATCLRVMLRFSSSEKPEMTQKDRDDLRVYMDLKDTISQEQDEFLELAKQKWDPSKLKITCENYINLRWQQKLKNLENLPRYYKECMDIPFVGDHEIRLQFISKLMHLGGVDKIVLPMFDRPYKLLVNENELQRLFPISNCVGDNALSYAQLPVSRDPKCEELAVANDVDIVISSGGLNTLLNNLDTNHTNSWILPVVVKAYKGKNIVYIDKPLPPIANTIIQKNTWIYKYILRKFLIHRKRDSRNSRKVSYDNDIFEDVTSEAVLKLEDNDNGFKGFSNNSLEDHRYVKQIPMEHGSKEKDESTSNHSKNTSSVHEDSSVQNSDNGFCENATDDTNTLPSSWNVSYKLFTISPQPKENDELMKNDVAKEYKILVRSKVDGIQKFGKQKIQFLMLAPKLEHQIGLGAEAVTLEEALKQWISIAFRPGASLARVRVAAETSEIIQVEKRTVISINNELRRLHGVKAEDSLKILYNVAQRLTKVSPGSYVLRHTVRNGAFAGLYKETDCPGKTILDLRMIYSNEFHTIHQAPWPVLDKMVPVPSHRCFERMPAMFYPTAKTKRKLTKNSNPGVLRKSLRIINKK